jgi:hypothetical protein
VVRIPPGALKGKDLSRIDSGFFHFKGVGCHWVPLGFRFISCVQSAAFRPLH